MNHIVYVLNGTNVDLLGKPQPAIYGYGTPAGIEADCRPVGQVLNLKIELYQSDAEFQIIDWIDEIWERAGGIVINPAASANTAVAILDALNTCEFPIIECRSGTCTSARRSGPIPMSRGSRRR